MKLLTFSICMLFGFAASESMHRSGTVFGLDYKVAFRILSVGEVEVGEKVELEKLVAQHVSRVGAQPPEITVPKDIGGYFHVTMDDLLFHLGRSQFKYMHWAVCNYNDSELKNTAMEYEQPTKPGFYGYHHYTVRIYHTTWELTCRKIQDATERVNRSATDFQHENDLDPPVYEATFIIGRSRHLMSPPESPPDAYGVVSHQSSEDDYYEDDSDTSIPNNEVADT
eukprot:GHVU01154687.1.p1 GENE.GHVU01154687.1~~GHVU01154687.1.p1  ORF type:complete len:225 (-),score=26.22 GHVU01154687.1:296-970(-)